MAVWPGQASSCTVNPASDSVSRPDDLQFLNCLFPSTRLFVETAPPFSHGWQCDAPVLLNDVSNLQPRFSHSPLLQKPARFVGEGMRGDFKKNPLCPSDICDVVHRDGLLHRSSVERRLGREPQAGLGYKSHLSMQQECSLSIWISRRQVCFQWPYGLDLRLQSSREFNSTPAMGNQVYLDPWVWRMRRREILKEERDRPWSKEEMPCQRRAHFTVKLSDMWSHLTPGYRVKDGKVRAKRFGGPDVWYRVRSLARR